MVKSLRRSGFQEKGDARILGSSDFVIQMIDEEDQKIMHQLSGKDLREAAGKMISAFCGEHNISIEVLRSGSRRQVVSGIRRQLTYKLVNELGLSLAEPGRQLGLTTSGVAQILRSKSFYK